MELAWADLVTTSNGHDILYDEAHSEIDKSYRRIDSEVGRAVFSDYLPLPYGAFYNGWRNYLLGKKLGVEKPDQRSNDEVQAFKNQCDQIAEAIEKSKSLYLSSYRSGTWPGDNLICIASLALHDKLFEPQYQRIISRWLERVKQNLDDNGLIPHAVSSTTGKILEPARGSSQSLMLIFLREIDAGFGDDQFTKYKELFLDKRVGIYGIREYPKGSSGSGDVDSGPVLFQIGASATIVGLRTMMEYDENSVAVALRNGIESFGIPTKDGGSKKYLFGKLPMADAFIAWCRSAGLSKIDEKDIDYSWRIQFHLYSCIPAIPLTIVLLMLTGVRFKRRKA